MRLRVSRHTKQCGQPTQPMMPAFYHTSNINSVGHATLQKCRSTPIGLQVHVIAAVLFGPAYVFVRFD